MVDFHNEKSDFFQFYVSLAPLNPRFCGGNKKNCCSNVAKLSGKIRIALKILFWFLSFFLCDLVFEIWSILYMVDHISRTKIHTKKTLELKNYFQSNAHLSWKVGHFCTIFFRQIKSGWHFDLVTIKDMQTQKYDEDMQTPPPPLRSGQHFKNFLKNVECVD